MYCNACGKPNPEGSAYCSSCGKPICSCIAEKTLIEIESYKPVSDEKPDNVSEIVATNQQDTEEVHTGEQLYTDEKDENFKDYFCLTWKKFMSSMLVLTFVILHMLCSAFPVIIAYAYAIDFITVYVLLLSIPGFLTSIGLWKIYFKARVRMNGPIQVDGIKWIKQTYKACAILLIVLLGVYLIGPTGPIWGSSGDGWWLIDVVTTVAVIIYLFLTMNLLENIEYTAVNEAPNWKSVKGHAIIHFVVGGVVIVYATISLNSFFVAVWMVLIACTAVLFGVILLQYRRMMEKLYLRKVNMQETLDNQTILVQNCGIVNADGTWVCKCGTYHKAYVATCHCGVNKSDLKKNDNCLVPSPEP